MTEDEYVALNNLPQNIFDHINSSDVIFLESKSHLTSDGEDVIGADLFQELILPDDDGRMTVNDYISLWDESRQEAFVSSMLSFPRINSSFRQMILASRPWVFPTLFLPVIITELAGDRFKKNHSVEEFLVEYATAKDIKILALEDPLNPFLVMDQAQQEEIVVEMEKFFSNKYSSNQLVEAYLHSIDVLKQSWMRGEIASREEYFALGIMLGLIETEEDYSLSDYQIALRETRESEWIKVLMDYIDDLDSCKIFVAVGNSHLTDFFISLFIENGFLYTNI
ncbi:hypothetical protein JCM12856_30450 [Spirochaeta dissipatitropha]